MAPCTHMGRTFVCSHPVCYLGRERVLMACLKCIEQGYTLGWVCPNHVDAEEEACWFRPLFFTKTPPKGCVRPKGKKCI